MADILPILRKTLSNQSINQSKFRLLFVAHGPWAGSDYYRLLPIWLGTSVFEVSSEGPPHLVPSFMSVGVFFKFKWIYVYMFLKCFKWEICSFLMAYEQWLVLFFSTYCDICHRCREHAIFLVRRSHFLLPCWDITFC